MDGAKALLTPEDAPKKADWLTSVPAGTTLEQQVSGNRLPASNVASGLVNVGGYFRSSAISRKQPTSHKVSRKRVMKCCIAGPCNERPS